MLKVGNTVLFKTIGFLIVNFLSISIFAQTSSVFFESKDQTSFQVSINKTLQVNSFENKILITKMLGERYYHVDIVFKNDTNTIKKNIYLIDEGFKHQYIITKNDILLKKIIPNTFLLNNKDITQVIFKGIHNSIPEITKDTNSLDSNKAANNNNHFNIPNYTGKIGCPWPIKPDDFTPIKNTVNLQTLEDSKFTTAKELTLNKCLTVQQISELIKFFQYEETKLDFAKYCYNICFDIDNYQQLKGDFDFENSMDELNEFIGSQ